MAVNRSNKHSDYTDLEYCFISLFVIFCRVTWAKTKGPPSRMRSESRSMTFKSAPIASARSVLLITWKPPQNEINQKNKLLLYISQGLLETRNVWGTLEAYFSSFEFIRIMYVDGWMDLAYKQIGLSDAGTALSRNLVPSRHVDDVDDVICQLPTEICSQIVCHIEPSLKLCYYKVFIVQTSHKQSQPQRGGYKKDGGDGGVTSAGLAQENVSFERLRKLLQGTQIDADILPNGCMWTPSCLHCTDALRSKSSVLHQKLPVLFREDIIRHLPQIQHPYHLRHNSVHTPSFYHILRENLVASPTSHL